MRTPHLEEKQLGLGMCLDTGTTCKELPMSQLPCCACAALSTGRTISVKGKRKSSQVSAVLHGWNETHGWNENEFK